MPVNFTTIPELIAAAVPALIQYEDKAISQSANARDLFINPPISHYDLQERSNSLFASMARRMRWAGPTDEQFNAQFPPADMPDNAVLIAVDGSQKYPDKDGLIWGLINIATIIWPMAGGQFGEIKKSTETSLLMENQLFSPSGAQVSDGHVSLLRDVRERETLARMAEGNLPNVYAIADGPMELWGGYSADHNLSGKYLTSLRQTIKAYESMRRHHIVNAGYVESTRTKLLITLMDIMTTVDLSLSEFRDAWNFKHFPGVFDRHIFEGWLRPGFRSAIFRLMTQAEGACTGHKDLEIHVFWLNVGSDKAPHIVRVEIPAWLASEKLLIGRLQALLFDQCHKIGGIPYPYLLLRADEEAHISPDEVDIVQRMLLGEYLQHRFECPDISPKKATKQVTHRWRHEV